MYDELYVLFDLYLVDCENNALWYDKYAFAMWE